MGRARRKRKSAEQPESNVLNHNGRADASTVLPTHEILRPDEVARWLRCSIRHVRNLVEAGRMEASDIQVSSGERQVLRIKRQSAIAFFEKRRTV